MSIAATACPGMICCKCEMCNILKSKTLSNSFWEGQLNKAKLTDHGRKSNQQINVVISVIINHTIKSDPEFTCCFLS